MHQTKLSTKYETKFDFNIFLFFACVVDTPDKQSFVNISANFEKNWNGPHGILTGPGDTDLWKKSDVENLVSDTL